MAWLLLGLVHFIACRLKFKNLDRLKPLYSRELKCLWFFKLDVKVHHLTSNVLESLWFFFVLWPISHLSPLRWPCPISDTLKLVSDSDCVRYRCLLSIRAATKCIADQTLLKKCFLQSFYLLFDCDQQLCFWLRFYKNPCVPDWWTTLAAQCA